MKKLFLFTVLLSFAFVTNGCSDNDDNKTKIKPSIIGTWELVEIYGLDGVGGQWTSVENGYTYTFETDGTFISNRFSECTNGTYILSETDGTLSFAYDCEDGGTFVENYVFSGQYLILTPTYLDCIEGCDYKFKKI